VEHKDVHSTMATFTCSSTASWPCADRLTHEALMGDHQHIYVLVRLFALVIRAISQEDVKILGRKIFESSLEIPESSLEIPESSLEILESSLEIPESSPKIPENRPQNLKYPREFSEQACSNLRI
jgi:hypothetical protein